MEQQSNAARRLTCENAEKLNLQLSNAPATNECYLFAMFVSVLDSHRRILTCRIIFGIYNDKGHVATDVCPVCSCYIW